MTQVLRGNIIQAPRLGELDIREHGYLVLEDGVVQGIYEALPQALTGSDLTLKVSTGQTVALCAGALAIALAVIALVSVSTAQRGIRKAE